MVRPRRRRQVAQRPAAPSDLVAERVACDGDRGVAREAGHAPASVVEQLDTNLAPPAAWAADVGAVADAARVGVDRDRGGATQVDRLERDLSDVLERLLERRLVAPL